MGHTRPEIVSLAPPAPLWIILVYVGYSLDGLDLAGILKVEVQSTIDTRANKILPIREDSLNTYKGGDRMADYKLTVEVLEARIAPIGLSQGGQ